MPSSSYRPMTVIVAATMKNGIGLNGGLPWRLPGEMKYFARVTTGENLDSEECNAVVMGRKTWDGIPEKFRPLRNRQNLIVSRNPDGFDLSPSVPKLSVSKHSSVTHALASLPERYTRPTPQSNGKDTSRSSRVFLIGGSQIYAQCLEEAKSKEPLVDRILLTRVLEPAFDECDVFLSDFAQQQTKKISGGREGKAWTQSEHRELVDWVGWDVPEGVVEEKGVKYRYEMWVRL
ncbi:hypothetical protein QFC21_004363 [Naganishia friedmannii]|uniref:Uncharacterized protein n=1 Tax=Naganishia friedmannii TaxID=89922 RepID=A0ACC2VIJ4_9TREE|nr:hypothetical protein QFC21_004363 [Naganishia friedmannii]